MNRRALVAILAIGALAAASGWLSRQSRPPETPVAEPAAPDYFTRDFVAVTTGPDGTPQRELRADHMVHLPEADVLELTAPYLFIYEQGTERWRASANEGRVERGGDLVKLQGNVRLQQEFPRPFVLATESLRIYPQREYAETAEPLTLTAPEGRVNAVGLKADMATQQIILLSKVRGIYEPIAR